MFASLSKHPCHLTCFLVFVCVVAFSARFAVFLDAVAFIVACWHARVCSGGWDGVGWGGVGGVRGVGGGMITFLFINVPACAFLTRCSFVCAACTSRVY